MIRAAMFAAFALALAPSAIAHQGATGIVKERMDAMSSIGQATKQIKQALQEPRDGAAIRRAAHAIASQSGTAMIRLFPKGSDQHPTKAKPAVWSNAADFADLANRLKDRADALSAQPTMANFKQMTAVCGACHKQFRAK